MADSDKNILITPNRGSATDLPKIDFTGADPNTITLSVLDDATLSFSGSSGQLFSISDNLDGTIFSVNDVSGIPSIEVDDDGTVRVAEFAGNLLVGTSVDNGYKLQVNGNVSISDQLVVGKGAASSYILMDDTDNGSRYIHCNSNRIGFLNSSSGWGSYCNDDGSWVSDTYVQSPRFVGTGSDTTPLGTAFSNTFKGQGTQRTVYFDGNGSSVSTWYGVGNNAFSAIDSTDGSMSLWVNPSNSTWYEVAQFTQNGISLKSGSYRIGTLTIIDQGLNLSNINNATVGSLLVGTTSQGLILGNEEISVASTSKRYVNHELTSGMGIPAPTGGQVLSYDSASDSVLWIDPPAGGGGASNSVYGIDYWPNAPYTGATSLYLLFDTEAEANALWDAVKASSGPGQLRVRARYEMFQYGNTGFDLTMDPYYNNPTFWSLMGNAGMSGNQWVLSMDVYVTSTPTDGSILLGEGTWELT